MTDIFDVAVIGAGMIGSATAKHISLHSQLKVCLIGPDEPKDKKTSKQSNYGSHYDEGRATRILDPDKIRVILSQRSIERYRDLEQQSGVKFFTECGCLIIGQEDSEYFRKLRQQNGYFNVKVDEFDQAELNKEFPYINIEKPCKGYFQQGNAGHISARGIVMAQKVLAEENGCKLVIDSAAGLEECELSHVIVHLESGRKVHTKRVLIATGAFTNFSGLLAEGSELNMEMTASPVIKYEVKKEDAQRLSKMPCIMNVDEQCDESGTSNQCLIIPPVLYPDGKYYMKVLKQKNITELKTKESLLDWFRKDISDTEKEFSLRFKSKILPDIKHDSIVYDSCVISITPTNHPYIGMISDLVGVAVGGNGYAAKSSDELGLIAAKMIIKGAWDYDIPQEFFQPRYI